MKKRRSAIAVFLLCAVLCLAVGYAALSDTLSVTVTASASPNDTAFDEDVYFSKAEVDTANTTSGVTATPEIDATQDSVTITISGLSIKGNKAVVNCTVQNDSALDVTLTEGTITNNNSDVFKVSTEWANNKTVSAGGSLSFTVTVEWTETVTADEFATISFDITAASAS